MPNLQFGKTPVPRESRNIAKLQVWHSGCPVLTDVFYFR
ncbi:Uncharacterized protein dnm_084090 [Desulfonema magnum]|uniref:Uncharacterized protein n=1 Tax=Desulfonema magnum TaxID=45655 RepID=A0A975BV45_9BACT|nr:Uncharacterized protein dnm_084090 [Desulfonema magnum]